MLDKFKKSYIIIAIDRATALSNGEEGELKNMKNDNYTLLDKTKRTYKKYLTKGLSLASALIMLGSATGCKSDDAHKDLDDQKDSPKIEKVTVKKDTKEKTVVSIDENSTDKDVKKTPVKSDGDLDKKPIVTETPKMEDDHKHKFSCWYAIDDEFEERACDYEDKVERRSHTYETVEIKFVDAKDGSHFVVTKSKCKTCGHIVTTTVKKDCDYVVTKYDSKKEYIQCTDCNHKTTQEHDLGVKTTNRNGTVTQKCMNPGCEYVYTYKPSHSTGSINNGGGSTGGSGSHRPSNPDEHIHVYGEWVSFDDTFEQTTCRECGEKIKREHKYTMLTDYKDFSESLHEVVRIKKCINCSHELIISKSYQSHNFDEGVISTDGKSITYTCKDCGHKYVKSIEKPPIHEHKYVEQPPTYSNITDATHDVKTIKICSCGDTQIVSEIKGVAHSFEYKYDADGNKVTNAAGTHYIKKCACGKTIEEIKDHKHTHNYTSKIILKSNGNGTHSQYNAYTCTNSDGHCDKPFYEQLIEGSNTKCSINEETERKVEFNEREHFTTVYGKCACGASLTDKLDIAAHNMSTNDNRVYTHDKDSYCYSVTEQCSGCSYTETQKHDHDYKSSSYQDPETGDITITYRCSCGVSYTETIPFVPTEHTHVYQKTGEHYVQNGDGTHTLVIEKTCTNIDDKCDKITIEENGTSSKCAIVSSERSETGYDDREHFTTVYGKCACGASLTDKLDIAAHNMSTNDNRVYTHDKDSYCYSVTEQCSGCSYTETQKHDHDYKSSSYQDPETGDITITYRCSCGASYTETIPFVPSADIPQTGEVVPGTEGLEKVEGVIPTTPKDEIQEILDGILNGDLKEDLDQEQKPKENFGQKEEPKDDFGQKEEPKDDFDQEEKPKEDSGQEEESKGDLEQEENEYVEIIIQDDQEELEPELIESQVEYKGKRLSFTYSSYKR